ncbi:ribose-phosphate pyrophosphokinase-like domain-containing protein [Patescibacteria group bacterium]|nr:ribose-phosphate pyrophosphokinase-like domain-containing protein [Patescibacteria group bacterium]
MDEDVLKKLMEKEVVMSNPQNMNGGSFAIVSGRTNPLLVSKVAKYLGVKPVFFDTKNWGNGQPKCFRPADVTFQGRQVFIVTSLQYRGVGSPVEELELMYEACASASATHIIPTWFCTKDDVDHGPGHIPNAPMIARRIRSLHPTSINCFDLHQSGHIGYFAPHRRRRFYFLRLLIEFAKKIGIDQIAGTDFSSTKRALKVEEYLQTGVPFVFAQKEHQHGSENAIALHQQFGKIIGEKIGLFDDMALTLGTLKQSAKNLTEMGAQKIYAFAPHFDPTPDTYRNLTECLEKGWLTALVTTNSTHIDQQYLDLGYNKFIVRDVSPFVGEVIRSIIEGKSTSPFFDDI